MSGSALSSTAVADGAMTARSRLRRRLARLGVVCATGAAAAVGGGLFGALNGWADLLNHFLPVWLALALVGAALSALAPGRVERFGLLLAGLAALGALLPVAAEFAAGRAEAAADTPLPADAFRLMTFNVWDGNYTPEAAAEVIRGSGADLVAVEEPSRLIAVSYPSLAGLYPYASPCGQGCDVAVLSKRPLRNLQVHGNRGPGPPKDPGQPNLITAEVDGPDGRPISIAAVHLVWPTPPGQQRLERRQLARMFAPALREDAVLLGDFNLTPWSFAMRGLDFSLKPMTRRTRGVLSYPARLGRLTPLSFLAIDQVFAGPDWRTARVERLARGGSDHYPVMVTLRRR